MLIVEIKNNIGQIVTVLTAEPKTFKTGSQGFYGLGKADIDGKRYQFHVQVVEIGSKNQGKAELKESDK
jgi:hypothetical protein